MAYNKDVSVLVYYPKCVKLSRFHGGIIFQTLFIKKDYSNIILTHQQSEW